MYVFELEKPGTWLDVTDADLAWRIQIAIGHLEDAFFEANLALNLFESERSSHAVPSKEAWLQVRDREARVLAQLRQAHPNRHDYAELHRLAAIIAKREAWQRGQEPSQLAHHRPFLHARSFLFSLDMFGRFLIALAEEASPVASLGDLSDSFDEAFPHVRGVRNTAAHLEDRSRGLGAGRNPKPMELAPVENEAIRAPGGVLVLSCLNGNRYGSTMACGKYGEVEVSAASMQVLQALLVQVYSRFSWRGSSEHLPRG